MPRTTVDIDASVLRELKRRAHAEKKSLGRTISEIVATTLKEGHEGAEEQRLRWTSRPMGPQVDLEDKDALDAALDGR